MVEGLDRFREHFQEYSDQYVIIGGVACDEWFSSQGLRFRGTKDIDIVLVVEALTRDFMIAFWSFVDEGRYVIKERTEGYPILYRFKEPKTEGFPAQLELFSRKPKELDLAEGQEIAPVQIAEGPSLSAILMNDGYYKLLLQHRRKFSGLSVVDVDGLIPLKARAYLDLSKRKAAGEQIDRGQITKHRNDVFRLTVTLSDVQGPRLPDSIKKDLKEFVSEFPVGSGHWTAITGSMKSILKGRVPAPADLLATLRKYFRLDL
jgi:hypothetical protein